MKHLKQKLIASALMLTVATAMMSTSTFAWFAISTAPEVKEIETSMEATDAFEIALGTDGTKAPKESELGDATTGDTTWGATVTGVENATGLNFPVQLSTGKFQAPIYNDSGRPGALGDLAITEGTITSGMSTVTTDINGETKNVASLTLLWLRSNKAITGATATLDGVTATGGTNVTEANVGVAIEIDGKITELTDGTPIAIGNFDANAAKSVKVYVYLKGTEAFNNAQMAENVTISVDKIIFAASTP